MIGRVAHIWRHPLKSHGREMMQSVTLETGKTIPFDRHWAVAHERHHFDLENPAWVPCGNFARGAKNPAIMAINSKLDETSGQLTLSHPNRPDLTFAPDNAADQQKFLNWIAPLEKPDSLIPRAIVKAPDRGMTDTDYPSISINSLSSLKALEAVANAPVDATRFRGNIWIDGSEPWAEFDLIGQEIQIGEARLKVVERIVRCKATQANPATGERDLATLDLLQDNWGHKDFGIYAQVIKGGMMEIGNALKVIS